MCELASQNQNLADYAKHWEERALQSEKLVIQYKAWAEWACKRFNEETSKDLQTQRN